MRKTLVAFLLLTSTLCPTAVSPQGSPSVRSLSSDWLLEVSLGRVPSYSTIRKFGSGIATTTLAPVTQSSFYRTPTSPVSLEVLSDDADDTAAGTGAQQVEIVGLGAGWTEVIQYVELNGVTPVPLPTPLLRLYRWKVYRSGSYADQTTPSQEGELTIRVAGGGDIWTVLSPIVANFGSGQSRIGVTSIPAGKTAFLLSYSATVDSTKVVNAYLFQRTFADDTTPPYTGTLRVVREIKGLTGQWDHIFPIPEGPIVGPADIGFMAIVDTTSGDISVDFYLLYADSELIPAN